MSSTSTQEDYEIRSISPVHINSSIMEGTQNYASILGPKRAVALRRYAPVFLVVPSISGAAGIPSTLFCSPGVVDAAPSPQRHYQWFADNDPIFGGYGDGFAYLQTSASMDSKVITCEVTATNRIGSASVLSSGLLVSLIEPVTVGEFYNFGITGMGAYDSVTVVMDQIAVLTGMWIDDFVSIFENDIFAITGVDIMDHISMPLYDVYAVNSYELLENIDIPNNGAESGITGWTVTAGTLRSVSTPTPSGGGSYAFMGSSASSVVTVANRIVNIPSGHHTEIDDGDCTLVFSFWACQNSTFQANDSFTLSIEILDSANTILRSEDYFGVIEPPAKNRNDYNFWGQYSASPSDIPVGARKVNIKLSIKGNSRSGGSYCQIDLISLQLFHPVV